MFLEIHILQNFALSNLNRDDTGASKSCIFGGTRRARISSQCLKRAIRTHFREKELIPSELLSYRTKWICRELSERLEKAGMNKGEAGQTAERVLELLDLKLKKGKTEYLLVLGDREINRLAVLCKTHSSALMVGKGKDQAKTDKKNKNEKSAEEKQIAQQLLDAINGGEALDIALFGRMIASHAEKNVDAAVQMAHAFSTHSVATEFDFFAAVDDLQKQEDNEGAGAAMLGTMLYNSSCYYRYANLDLKQLAVNLGNDTDNVKLATRAFLAGAVHAVPSGKQTNSAAQNPPAFIMAVLRKSGLWSLANAFIKPVYPGVRGDMIQLSARHLISHWNQLNSLYGDEGISYVGIATYIPATDLGIDEKDKKINVEENVSNLIGKVMEKTQSMCNWGGNYENIASETGGAHAVLGDNQ